MVLGIRGREDGNVFGVEIAEEGRADDGGGVDVDSPIREGSRRRRTRRRRRKRRGDAAHGVWCLVRLDRINVKWWLNKPGRERGGSCRCATSA